MSQCIWYITGCSSLLHCAQPIGALLLAVLLAARRIIDGLAASAAYASAESLATRSTRWAELMPPAAGSAHGACCAYCGCHCCCPPPPGRPLGESASALRCCAIGCWGIIRNRGALPEAIIGGARMGLPMRAAP